jgi:hypothetical protein
VSATGGFLVDRRDLATYRWGDSTDAATLLPGYALLRVQRFAFTANNITYARVGEDLGFWNYFPAPAGWGHIPVWGFADVEQSLAPGLVNGERVYGFFPMASHLLVMPDRMRDTGFSDGVAHRAALPRAYNEYVRVDRLDGYDAGTADYYIVLRPLFILAFFLVEFLKEAKFFEARRVIVSSASSKAAQALAFLLRRDEVAGIEMVGLTGKANVAVVTSLGLYDRVLPYDRVDVLESDVPSIYVDMAGDAATTRNIHDRVAPSLKYSASVGFTRSASENTGKRDLPGPRPEFFFTATHIAALRQAWGAEKLHATLAAAWASLLAYLMPRLSIQASGGRETIERVYLDVLNGRVPPGQANVLAFAHDITELGGLR